ncbi:MAG: topoisomerase C-terminal repeat-containing protein [Oscillospiraceae bacterium]|nr:topoisomerase C-terminal repeat-containing protein [Oscillospiraceae bacterium]
MKLIIAEKPSLGRNIAGSIGAKSRGDGFLFGDDYIVTWVFGHLFSLADIEHYNPNPDGTNRWSLKNIPCFPEQFVFELKRDSATKQVDSGVIKQFETIKALINRDDVDMIINAGDADREGEIIVRTCVTQALESEKPFMRLWLPDQTPETIRTALSEMKPETEYENLANEGYARTYIDWLYGVNLTRYATLKNGRLLRVGRVIVPIVKAIYERDMAIRNFKPDIYYALVSKAETNGEEIELQSKEQFSKNELHKAQDMCNKYNAERALVTSKKKKKDTMRPGKLYSLTKLQNVLGKKYKMPMEQSLKIVQELYERGYVTYPRTNSEYLATAEKGKVKNILDAVAKIGYPVKFKDGKTIFDDSKIESHSALTPTHKIPKKTDLSQEEFTVYSTIMRRFVAVFCAEDCVVEKTEITIDVGGFEEFNLKGTVITEPGWTKYDDYSKKDKILPALEKGDEVNIDFKPTEKETQPPKHYTIETLNNYLKNPFREDKKKAAEEESDEEEYKAIFEGLELGTEATRTGIIDNAKKSRYIELKKDVYKILPDGENLIESLARMNINMDKYKTAEVGKALKKVFRGEIHIDNSIELAKSEIREVFEQKPQPPELDTDDGFFGDIAGKCPLCGCDVTRTSFGYGCSGYRENGCKFGIRNVICSRVISIANVRTLLETGKSHKIEGFISPRTGKSFSAYLKLDNGRAVFDFED